MVHKFVNNKLFMHRSANYANVPIPKTDKFQLSNLFTIESSKYTDEESWKNSIFMKFVFHKNALIIFRVLQQSWPGPYQKAPGRNFGIEF